MEGTRKEEENCSNNVEKDSNVEEWLILGGHKQLLEINCVMLKRRFEREDKKFEAKNVLVGKNINECLRMLGDVSKSNKMIDEEVEDWCRLVVLFLTTRVRYIYCKRRRNGKEKRQDRLRSLSFWSKHDWFEKGGVDAMIESGKVLYGDCYSNKVYPFEDVEENDQLLLRLKDEGNKESGKKEWRSMAVSHLRNLIHFYLETGGWLGL